jgi:hypothetical protein
MWDAHEDQGSCILPEASTLGSKQTRRPSVAETDGLWRESNETILRFHQLAHRVSVGGQLELVGTRRESDIVGVVPGKYRGGAGMGKRYGQQQ